ncbi:MAG TPA: response regulator [Candidatus Acidoferrum sp.]|nr:response regulator [Candidatus Acidoferrum sp.]
MSGLQDFLAPFSHLLFANRDKAIVALGLLLGWFTIQLLIARWRNERLQRDLAAAKSAPSGSSSRRYAPSAQVEEPPVESGALPPVKGGRTYARNLGTALSKAGISSSQQIYSPPAPQGWAPNSNAGQPGMGQPPQGAPYGPPNTPWGASAPPQQAAPWGFPGGAGRPMPPQSPSQAPFYQPPMPQQQPGPMPPTNTPPSAPGFFGPPSAPAFAHPAFAPPTSGPAGPAPPTAQPAAQVGPPPPAYSNPPAGPAPEPAAQDAGRRGKPKRRRFNFNVLENLEKIVQTRSEPLPPTGWQPPAGATPTQAAPPPTVPPVGAPPELRVLPQPAPSAEAMSPVKEPAGEAPSLPLPFGQVVQDTPKTTEQDSAATETEEPGVVQEDEEPAVVSETETSKDVSDTEAEAPVAEIEVEEETPPATPPAPEPRKSMREMLFGEEAPAAAEPTATPSQSEPEPASADWSWRPTRWEPAEGTAPTPENEPAASEPAAEEPVAEEAAAVDEPSEASPVAEASEPAPFAPWKSSFAADSAIEAEPAKVGADEASAGSVTETPAGDAGGGPSAGTVVIIEDDETAASYYATLFRGNGYRVEVANDGVSGVDLCTRVQPQVILLDVMMPRQNGILVLQTLRASDETKNTPVVVMSNFSEPTLIKRAIQLGALEYVIKTQVEGTALLNAMPRWMNREKAFAAA